MSVLQMGKLRPPAGRRAEVRAVSFIWQKCRAHQLRVGSGQVLRPISGYLPWWQGVFSICRDEGCGEQVHQRMCVRGSLPARWDPCISHGRFGVCQEERGGQPPQSPALQGWEGVRGLLPELLPPHHMASPSSRNFSNHLPDLLFSQRKDQGPNPRLSALCQVPLHPPPQKDWDRSQKGHTVALTLCPAPPSAAQG